MTVHREVARTAPPAAAARGAHTKHFHTFIGVNGIGHNSPPYW